LTNSTLTNNSAGNGGGIGSSSSAQSGVATCNLPPATIAVTRTAGQTLGSIEESTYMMSADTSANFRIDPTACQYIYNLAASALGTSVYRMDISINSSVAGSVRSP
jgi:hypothetical protein